MREEIPHRAFINAQILQEAQGHPSFQAAVKQVAGDYGIGKYEFMNPAYVASLLYCLLVVPRELFVAGNDFALDSRLPAKDVTDFFKVELDTDGVASRSSQFLRRLRNSVAHARFSVDEKMNFKFTDRKPHASQDEFIIGASFTDLEKFLSQIGALLANLRSSPLANANDNES